MKPSTWIACAALLAGLSVAAGAFGAHGLTERLKNDRSLAPDQAAHRLEIFQKGAQYQMYHALAIAVVGLLGLRTPSPCLTAAGSLFVAGIVLFCGFLYALGLGAPSTFAMPVPFGGGAFIIGWCCLAIGALKSGKVLESCTGIVGESGVRKI